MGNPLEREDALDRTFHVEEILQGPEGGIRLLVADGSLVAAVVVANRGINKKCETMVDACFLRMDHYFIVFFFKEKEVSRTTTTK